MSYQYRLQAPHPDHPPNNHYQYHQTERPSSTLFIRDRYSKFAKERDQYFSNASTHASHKKIRTDAFQKYIETKIMFDLSKSYLIWVNYDFQTTMNIYMIHANDNLMH